MLKTPFIVLFFLVFSLPGFAQPDDEGTIKVRKPGCDVNVKVKITKGRTSYETHTEMRYEFKITPTDYHHATLVIESPEGRSVYARKGIRHIFYVNRSGNGPVIPSGTYNWVLDYVDSCGKAHQKTGDFKVRYPSREQP